MIRSFQNIIVVIQQFVLRIAAAQICIQKLHKIYKELYFVLQKRPFSLYSTAS